MAFLYETHLHTCFGSRCASSTGAEHARFYKKLGYDGIIVTDHFFGGNTRPERNQPWADYVNRFCRGYEDAYEEGQRIGLKVFFGWEQGYGDDEYLVYGPDKEWLLKHPEIARCSRAQQLELVHAAGGCVVQAHPFRMRPSYMKYIRLGLRFCDAVEAANSGNDPVNDCYALRYAQEYGLPVTAGSDNHNSASVTDTSRIFGIETDRPLSDASDLAKIILSKERIGLRVCEGWFDRREDEPELTSYWLDENEELVPTGRKW